MMRALRFVDYTAHGEDGPEALIEVVRHVHAFNREHGNALGIDFPQWSAGESLSCAEQVRVFGAAADLSAFIAQPRALRLLGMGHLARTALADAPADAPLAAVVRDNAADKNKPAHAARRLARGGEAFQGKRAEHGFTLGLTSKSTGHAFALKLRKKTAVAGEVLFNSYGLCTTGGLPQF